MKKFIIFLVLIILIGILSVHAYMDTIVENAIEKYGTQALGVKVRVGNVKIGPKFNSISVHNLSIANPEGYSEDKMIYIGNIHISADLLSLVSAAVMNIEAVNIDGLAVNYQLDKNGNDNFSALKRNVGEEHIQDEASKSTPQRKVAIKVLTITNLSVTAELNPNLKKNLTLANITINDIGASKGGVTISHALEEVVTAVSRALAEANLTALIKQLLNVKDLKDAVTPIITDSVKGLGEKLDGIMGK